MKECILLTAMFVLLNSCDANSAFTLHFYSMVESSMLPHPLKKRSVPFLGNFAVCEPPLYELCLTNISRLKCVSYGCCFFKNKCYNKAVPSYTKAFAIMIVVVFGLFILSLAYIILGERKRREEIFRERESSEESAGPEERENQKQQEDTHPYQRKETGEVPKGWLRGNIIPHRENGNQENAGETE
ncbi:testis-expressed protein 29 [Rhinatrema bivittatum]|uniref:testis-expressed protein 29 n=1 Tax=Rhinatrema bivittatum TaxID=194408 RepID=UPI0011278DB2|nr:testis-expressed protein 29 [Rhinatrema bivittatum]